MKVTYEYWLTESHKMSAISHTSLIKVAKVGHRASVVGHGIVNLNEWQVIKICVTQMFTVLHCFNQCTVES